MKKLLLLLAISGILSCTKTTHTELPRTNGYCVLYVDQDSFVFNAIASGTTLSVALDSTQTTGSLTYHMVLSVSYNQYDIYSGSFVKISNGAIGAYVIDSNNYGYGTVNLPSGSYDISNLTSPLSTITITSISGNTIKGTFDFYTSKNNYSAIVSKTMTGNFSVLY